MGYRSKHLDTKSNFKFAFNSLYGIQQGALTNWLKKHYGKTFNSLYGIQQISFPIECYTCNNNFQFPLWDTEPNQNVEPYFLYKTFNSLYGIHCLYPLHLDCYFTSFNSLYGILLITIMHFL